MGLMVAQNADGVSLAKIIAQFFTDLSNDITFPMLTFLSGGIINFFVPSGGGQWAVQGPIVMPAATEIAARAGIDATNYYGRAAMGIAWGDQWTNMIQPFWALPALGVAGLKAKDIMGYLVVVLLFTGLVAILGFLGWGLLFSSPLSFLSVNPRKSPLQTERAFFVLISFPSSPRWRSRCPRPAGRCRHIR